MQNSIETCGNLRTEQPVFYQKQINLISRASPSTVQFSGNYAVELAIFTMTTFDYNYQYSFRFCFLIQIWHPAED